MFTSFSLLFFSVSDVFSHSQNIGSCSDPYNVSAEVKNGDLGPVISLLGFCRIKHIPGLSRLSFRLCLLFRSTRDVNKLTFLLPSCLSVGQVNYFMNFRWNFPALYLCCFYCPGSRVLKLRNSIIQVHLCFNFTRL